MMKGLSILPHEPEDTSAIVLCDRPINGDSDDERFEQKITRFPFHIISDGKWQRISLGKIIKSLRSDDDAEQYLRRGSIVSLLINSEGGDSFLRQKIEKVLRKGQKKYTWNVQAIIGKCAISAAANLATVAQQIFLTPDARLFFHYGTQNGREDCDVDDRHYENPYTFLNRLKSKAEDRIQFERSVVALRFKQALDHPHVSSKNFVEISGSDLANATAGSLCTPQMMRDAIGELLQICPLKDVRVRLERFLRVTQKKFCQLTQADFDPPRN